MSRYSCALLGFKQPNQHYNLQVFVQKALPAEPGASPHPWCPQTGHWPPVVVYAAGQKTQVEQYGQLNGTSKWPVIVFIQMCHTCEQEHCAVENIIPGREQWWGENQMALVGNRLVNGDRRASLQLKRWCLFLTGGSLPSPEATALIWPSCLILQHWINSGARFSIIVYMCASEWKRRDSHQSEVAQHGRSLFGTICRSLHSSSYSTMGHFWHKFFYPLPCGN